MTKSPNQFSEHKKALRIRSQRIQQRDWIINQKRRSFSTNLSSSFIHHQISRSGFKFGQVKIMRKDVPLSNQLEDIPKLVNGLDFEWNSFQTVFNTISRFKKLLSHEYDSSTIDQIIDSGAVQYFVQYLDATNIEKYCQVKKTDDEPIDPSKMNVISLQQLCDMQSAVSWCITNIASDTNDHTKYIVETGCVPLLIHLLESEDCEVRRLCACAIGNIAIDSLALRDYVVELGVMNHLVKVVEIDQTLPTRKDAVWAISVILKGKPTPNWDLVGSAIPLMCQLILNRELNEEVLSDACYALAYATSGPPEIVECITKQRDVIMRLVELLNHPMEDVQATIVCTVGNLLTKNSDQTHMVVSCGVLPCLTKLFEHPSKRIRKEVMWSVSNITAGSIKLIQEVIDAEIFPKLIFMLSPDNNEAVEVKNEMYYVIVNALAGGNDTQIQYLIDQGVIQQLCGGLDLNSTVLTILLEGLELLLKYGERSGTLREVIKIMEDYGGIERIEVIIKECVLQQEDHDRSLYILETYGKTKKDV